MCPATLALAAVAANAAGSILGGVTAAESASFQGQIAKNNATAAQQNAAYSAKASAAQTEQAGLKAAQQDAGVKAAGAANNLDVNTGSPLDIQESQRKLGVLDTATVANRGAEQVYGYATQERNFSAQAAADQAEVGPDIAGGVLKAAGSVAGGVSQTSLLSGSPSVSAPYKWMASNDAGASDFELG